MVIKNFMELLDYLPDRNPIPADQVPEPYRTLLVHERDMTGTLENYYAEKIHLHTLARFHEGDSLYRSVLLKTESGRVVEFGAIRISLMHFSGTARKRVLDCYQPLGAILNEFGIRYRSRLGGFVSLATDASLEKLLEIDGPSMLYGRRNTLATPAGEIIAEVLEILPTVRTL